jgi:hypothetical protein
VSTAREFVRSHPGLARAMQSAATFAAIKDRAALDIDDDERLYIVRGDTLGDEEDLFVEALVRGAQSEDPADLNRALYLEIDDEARQAVDQRVNR